MKRITDRIYRRRIKERNPIWRLLISVLKTQTRIPLRSFTLIGQTLLVVSFLPMLISGMKEKAITDTKLDLSKRRTKEKEIRQSKSI
jgi:hypothetical protein